MKNIYFQRVCFAYGEETIFQNYDLQLTVGKTYCLLGASGAGKTTLTRLLMGFIKPQSGKIMGLENLNLAAVFQEDRLCENLTVGANLQLVRTKKISLCQIESYLEQVGLKDSLKTSVKKLSGGMKRRVAIVRAIMVHSDLLILDEPFKGLDQATKMLVVSFLQKHIHSKQIVLIVTHDKEDIQLLQSEGIDLT